MVTKHLGVVELRDIIEDNIVECMELSISPEQSDFVAPNAETLAEAYILTVNNAALLKPYVVYAEGQMVGFIIYGKWADNNEYHNWAIMIDKQFQGRGYGKSAIELLLSEIRSQPFGAADKITAAYEKQNTASQKLFKAFGFTESLTPTPDDEIVAELWIK